jgi:hypothetical protein
LLGSLLAAFLVAGQSAFAACVLNEVHTAAENTVVMENDFVRMTVDLQHGGKVTGFLYKPLNREWLISGQALFIDHVWQQSWPGELYNVPYEYAVLAKDADHVAVKVWRTLNGYAQPSISGVKIERTMELTADSPAVKVTVAVSNPTTDVKTVGYWSQHIFRLGGLNDNYNIRPFTNGLSVATFEASLDGKVKEDIGQDFVKNPTAGWTATLNPVTGETAVFLMDYNDLRWLYNCIGNYTTEWYYDLLRMSPGRVWTTHFTLLPTAGYRGVSYASHSLIADARIMRDGAGDRLVYTVGSGEAPLGEVTLTATLQPTTPIAKPLQETIKLGNVGFQPREVLSGLALPAANVPFVLKVRLQAGKDAQTFEKHFGVESRADRLQAGVFKTGYSVKAPLKTKIIDRSSVTGKVPHTGTAVLEVRGQFFPSWRVEESLKGLGAYTLQPSHYTSNVYGDQLDYLPPGLKEALALDAIVLNNVPVEALEAEGATLIKEYVKSGGGLLVFGGWFSFGAGHYGDSALADLLPVVSGKPFDIHWYPQGLELQKGPGAASLGAFNLPAGLKVLWQQELPSVKPEAKVVITAGGKPFLVTGTYGKGRVACVLGTTAGVAPEGSTAFFDSPEWPTLLGQVITWLKNGN